MKNNYYNYYNYYKAILKIKKVAGFKLLAFFVIGCGFIYGIIFVEPQRLWLLGVICFFIEGFVLGLMFLLSYKKEENVFYCGQNKVVIVSRNKKKKISKGLLFYFKKFLWGDMDPLYRDRPRTYLFSSLNKRGYGVGYGFGYGVHFRNMQAPFGKEVCKKDMTLKRNKEIRAFLLKQEVYEKNRIELLIFGNTPQPIPLIFGIYIFFYITNGFLSLYLNGNTVLMNYENVKLGFYDFFNYPNECEPLFLVEIESIFKRTNRGDPRLVSEDGLALLADYLKTKLNFYFSGNLKIKKDFVNLDNSLNNLNNLNNSKYLEEWQYLKIKRIIFEIEDVSIFSLKGTDWLKDGFNEFDKCLSQAAFEKAKLNDLNRTISLPINVIEENEIIRPYVDTTVAQPSACCLAIKASLPLIDLEEKGSFFITSLPKNLIPESEVLTIIVDTEIRQPLAPSLALKAQKMMEELSEIRGQGLIFNYGEKGIGHNYLYENPIFKSIMSTKNYVKLGEGSINGYIVNGFLKGSLYIYIDNLSEYVYGGKALFSGGNCGYKHFSKAISLPNFSVIDKYCLYGKIGDNCTTVLMKDDNPFFQNLRKYSTEQIFYNINVYKGIKGLMFSETVTITNADNFVFGREFFENLRTRRTGFSFDIMGIYLGFKCGFISSFETIGLLSYVIDEGACWQSVNVLRDKKSVIDCYDFVLVKPRENWNLTNKNVNFTKDELIFVSSGKKVILSESLKDVYTSMSGKRIVLKNL